MHSSLKLLFDISMWFSVLNPTNSHPTYIDATSCVCLICKVSKIVSLSSTLHLLCCILKYCFFINLNLDLSL